jgi:hypothetical protein
MDFVQRNLINERNNLQVELAKAKLLIAELSEAATLLRGMEAAKRKSEMSGKKLPTEEEASEASSGMGTRIKRPGAFKRKFNEEAEYISDLENVIMSIAESMNMSVEELMEYNSPRNLQRMANMARQNNSKEGLKPLGGGIPPARHADERLGGMLAASGVHGAAGSFDGKVVMSQRHLSGGYNQDSKVISDKTPIEFKNPDVKPETMARAENKVREGSRAAQRDRAEVVRVKAAEAERASRTY